jgi:hypothetical protein
MLKVKMNKLVLAIAGLVLIVLLQFFYIAIAENLEKKRLVSATARDTGTRASRYFCRLLKRAEEVRTRRERTVSRAVPLLVVVKQ